MGILEGIHKEFKEMKTVYIRRLNNTNWLETKCPYCGKEINSGDRFPLIKDNVYICIGEETFEGYCDNKMVDKKEFEIKWSAARYKPFLIRERTPLVLLVERLNDET